MLFHPNYLYLLMTVTVFVKCEFIQTENPCKKTTCETISTQLITKHQYLNSVSKSHHSQPNKLLHSKSGQDSWINILRRRKRRRLKHRHRLKRSPTRTIVSVNSDYQRRRRSNSKCHKYARFQVFREDFTLCLILGDILNDPIVSDNRDITVSIYGSRDQYRSSTLSSMHLQIAEGHVLGQVHSGVRGYVWRDKFYGTVMTPDDTLHIEPLAHVRPVNSRFIRGANKTVNAYVYRVFSKQRYYNKYSKKVKRRRHVNRRLRYRRSHLWRSNAKLRRSRRYRRHDAPVCRSCGLLLVADSSFYREVGERSVKGTVMQLLYHVRELNILLRQQDYDKDGHADCVGVHVAGVGVIKSKSSSSNILDTGSRGHMSPNSYLKTFSRYQLDGYCLAILFSSKVFAGKVLGLSWRADNVTRAGICQSRTNVGSPERPEMLNLNSLFITMRTKHMDRIPLRMGVLNLAHEVLHSFGASHDPDTVECGARYIMSRYSGSGVHHNNELISPCTGRSVAAVLRSPQMTQCLVTRSHGHQGYCGDGELDNGEQCDCGDTETCVQTRSPCVPPGLRKGEEQCTIRHQDTDCTRLGLISCQCTQHVNDVSPPPCLNCCRSRRQDTGAGDCRPAEEWTRMMFDEMQHYLARLCWSSTVSSCMSLLSPRYSSLLSKLSSLRSGSSGRVFCLRTGLDSNCWQMDFHCDKYHDKYKKYNKFI